MSKFINYRFIILFFLLLLIGDNMPYKTDSLSEEVNVYVDSILNKSQKYIYSDTEKSFLYLNEVLKYRDKIDSKQLLKLYKGLAIAHSNQQSGITSLDYYYKSLELQKNLEPEKMHYTYNNIGGMYFEMGNNRKAKKYWNLSLNGFKKAIAEGTEKKNLKSHKVYSNLAVLELIDGNYSKASQMLKEYYKECAHLQDTVGMIICYENQADVQDKLNRSDSCKYYLKKAINLSKKINSDRDLAFLYCDLGAIYRKTTNDSAGYYLTNAFALADKNNLNEVRLKSARTLADLYEQKRDYKNSIKYLRIASALSEENISKQSTKKVELLEFENEQQIKHQQLIVQAKKRESLLVFSFILLLPISLSIFLMYRLQRTRAKKRQAENALLIEKLEGKNKRLTSNAIQMLQTSEIIDATHKELRQLKGIANTPTNNMLRLIISDLRKGNQSFNKKEFEKVFIETDEEFYKKLLKAYPTLTKNEIRLCAFAKMSFSTKEISAITHQSTNSILVARFRLRKKIGLEENQSLTTFFKSF